MSIFSKNTEPTYKPPSTPENTDDHIELEDLRETIIAKDILVAALGEVAAKQDNGEDIVSGETFLVRITEEIADPGEVTDLGASALRSAMAMHRDSHHPFLVSVNNDTGGESAELMCM